MFSLWLSFTLDYKVWDLISAGWRWRWRYRGLSALSTSPENNRPHHWGTDQHHGKHQSCAEHHQRLPVVERFGQLPPPTARKNTTSPTSCQIKASYKLLLNWALVSLVRGRNRIRTAPDRPIRTQSWRSKAAARSTRSSFKSPTSIPLVFSFILSSCHFLVVKIYALKEFVKK